MRALAWIVLAGCGRFGFGSAVDDASDGAVPEVAPPCAGHDEDADGFPDPCDVCPTVIDPAQLDGEGDGVGDACDPRPATGGDYIMMFESHADAATASYTRTSGDASWQGDALRLGTLLDGGSASYVLAAYPSRIAFATRIVEVSTTEQLWFGAWYNRVPVGGDPKIFAHGAWVPATPNAEFSLKEQDAAGTERHCPGREGPAVFRPGDRFTFVIDTDLITGGEHAFAITGDGASWSCTLSVSVPKYNEGFLESFKAIVDYDHFIVYGIR